MVYIFYMKGMYLILLFIARIYVSKRKQPPFEDTLEPGQLHLSGFRGQPLENQGPDGKEAKTEKLSPENRLLSYWPSKLKTCFEISLNRRISRISVRFSLPHWKSEILIKFHSLRSITWNVSLVGMLLKYFQSNIALSACHGKVKIKFHFTSSSSIVIKKCKKH